MRSRFSRRNRLIGDALESEGKVARNQTILGTGEVPFYTDLDITIAGTPIAGGGAGGAIPSIYPPPGPGLPPTGPPPSGVSALQAQTGIPFWVNVNTPPLTTNFVYRHTYDFPAKLKQVFVHLASSAVVGNRIARLALYDDSENRVGMYYPAVAGQVANRTYTWQFCANWYQVDRLNTYGPGATAILVQCWLFDLTILPNWTLRSEFGDANLNLYAGDQVSNIKLLMVREPSY
jgi:hypothetical protein